jgi:hypothetical protein
MVADWTIPRRGEEPRDFWSQSFSYGSAAVNATSPARVRFRNSGGKSYLRAEAHLVYKTGAVDATKVTFDWTDDKGPHRESHVFDGRAGNWHLSTGRNAQTRWVEFEPVVRR